MSSLPPASGPVRGQVLCRARSGTLLTFNIKGEKTFVGRDPGLGVSVPLDGISRRHARITFDGKHYWIEDLKSTNGTFLNGEPVQKDRLRHLDVITLGKKAELLFVLRSGEPQVVKRRGIVRAALTPGDAPDATPHEVGVGELTLGRSAACNVQAESAVVSKVHAQLRRTIDQLAVQDLGSSNGTFVNGNRVMSAELHDGDVLSLGGVENYRVVVELGEVTSASGAYSAAAPATPAPERPRFSNAWKTRFEWDPEELKEIAAAQQAGIAKAPEQTLMPKAGVKPPLPAAPKPPIAAKPAAVPTSKPPAIAAPAASAAGPASRPQAPAKPAPPAVARPASVASPTAPPPRPAAAPAPSPPPPRLEPTVAQDVPSFAPAPAPAPTPKTRILEVRLAGSGYDLSVLESGAHNLGRAKDAPLRVDHPTVSRKHARIILGDDRSVAYLQDAGGANGTILNGVALQELKPIQDGDRIRIGEVELIVTLRRA